jgi:hypothetical protein
VAAAGKPSAFGNGMQALRLRLTPPLAAVPDTAEVVVTGPATQVRATVPIGPAAALRRLCRMNRRREGSRSPLR